MCFREITNSSRFVSFALNLLRARVPVPMPLCLACIEQMSMTNITPCLLHFPLAIVVRICYHVAKNETTQHIDNRVVSMRRQAVLTLAGT